jgi:SAM-dependent methyltransferase
LAKCEAVEETLGREPHRGFRMRCDRMKPAGSDELEPLLAEQLAYYRALGLGYEDPTIWGLGGSEVAEALDSFGPTGDVLELACGTGMWTQQLLRHATSVTAVDAAPEMLAVAAARFGDSRVRFVEADLFHLEAGPSLRRCLLRLPAVSRAP